MMFGVMPGTLDVLVLKALDTGASHGYGIARWVRETTDGEVAIEEGALYTALHRLEKRRLLKSQWKESDTGRRAKFYALTPEGRRVLLEQTATWHRKAGALFKVLDAPSGRGSK